MLFLFPADAFLGAFINGLLDFFFQAGVKVLFDDVSDIVIAQSKNFRAAVLADSVSQALVAIDYRFPHCYKTSLNLKKVDDLPGYIFELLKQNPSS